MILKYFFYEIFLLIFLFLIKPEALALTLQVGTPIGGTCVGELSACQSLFTKCWNDQAPGTTACGTGQGCTFNGSSFGNPWEFYNFDWQTSCKASDATGDSCTAWFQQQGDVCSTADKYNGGPDFPGGDLTVARFGSCTCTTGSIYKTCCSNGAPINTYNFTAATGQGNPDHPDAGCAGTSFPQCGNLSLGQPSCGQAACAQLGTPPPQVTTCPNNPTSMPCSNPQCPSGYTYSSDSQGHKVCVNSSTGQLDCNTKPYCPGACPSTSPWTGEQCTCGTPETAATCGSDSTTCNKCSTKYCLIYSQATGQPTTCCYYNDKNTCTVDANKCKGFGTCTTDKCAPGSTRVTCSAPNICSAP